MRVELESLESVVGYHFRDRRILLRALTHSSHVHEQSNADGGGESEMPNGDNEQLEFFGDAVLGFLISEALYRKFPAFSEGSLSKLKAHLVSAAHLFEVAQKLEIGKYLFLGRGEEMSGGRSKKTLQVDGLEALIAGMCLDGGVEAARDFVTRHVLAELEEDYA
ncbi:MAG: ribonuclease III domain-containing protein, partial [Bryobacteraceae bacterium]